MFGNIKEYSVLEVTKKVIEKNKVSFDEFSKKDLKEIENILDDKGLVFALAKKIDKKKVVKGLYLFKLEIKEEQKTLIFDKNIFVEEIKEEVLVEFEELLDEVLGSVVSEQQVHSVKFKEKEFELKKIKIGKYEISGAILWFLAGIILSILLDNFIWFGIFICFGLSSNYVVKKNGKKVSKREEKRKNKKVVKKK